jgi:hypothetical protein
MRTSTVCVLLLDVLRRRSLPIVAALMILCAGLAQIGADGNRKGLQDDGDRTLDVIDCGFALPIEITAIRNLHSLHWLSNLELRIYLLSRSTKFTSGFFCQMIKTTMVIHMV